MKFKNNLTFESANISEHYYSQIKLILFEFHARVIIILVDVVTFLLV